MKNAKMVLMVLVLAAASAAFGESYDPAVHGNPIVMLTDEAIVIDGNGTTIDGGGTNRCATLGPNVTLRNFKLKNGFAAIGGGVYGGRLEACEISGCQAGESAAALAGCTAVGCTISGNRMTPSDSSAAVHGGLLLDATLTDCTISGNDLAFGGKAPVFGGLGERVTVSGGTVKDNAVRCDTGVCYGLRFAYSTVDGAYADFDDGTGGAADDPTHDDPTHDDPTSEDPQPDPSAFEPEPPFLPAVGEGMVDRYYAPTYLDLLNGGLARTFDKRTTVKAEGLPTGLKLVKTAVEGGYSYSIEGVPKETLDGTARRAYVRITDAAKNVTYFPLSRLRIQPAVTAVFPPATNKVAYWKLPVAKIWPDYVGNEKNWTFSGWPSGIRFATKETKYDGAQVAAGRVYGKPTKVGVFTVKATEKIVGTSYKSTHLASFAVFYEDGVEPSAPAVKPEPAFDLSTGDLHETVETVKDINVGVACDWAIDVEPFATVSASGLPTGLSLKSQSVKDPASNKSYKTYAVQGVPSKDGFYLTTFTVKKDGVTVKRTAAFRVEILPAWAQGTFDGGADESFAVGGQATFTVSKVGKLSGKWMSLGTNWTLSAAAYARYDRDVTQYVANVVGKTGSGKKAVAFTNELTVAASEEAELGGLATSELHLAYQNRWGAEPWKTIAKKFAKASEIAYVPTGFATNETVSLKVGATGKVTVKGKFVKSVDERTRRVTWHSASGSAVLCPQTAPSDDGSFDGVVFVYFPPKAKTPLADGYDACVWVRWSGASGAFTVLQPAEDDGE